MNLSIQTNPVDGLTWAENRDTGERAVAICHPDDMFDEEIGIRLAIKRLIEGCTPGDHVLVGTGFLKPVEAKYIIHYYVNRFGWPGSYMDRIDQNPQTERNGRPVQYLYDYETSDGYALLVNRLTGKIAITKTNALVRA